MCEGLTPVLIEALSERSRRQAGCCKASRLLPNHRNTSPWPNPKAGTSQIGNQESCEGNAVTVAPVGYAGTPLSFAPGACAYPGNHASAYQATASDNFRAARLAARSSTPCAASSPAPFGAAPRVNGFGRSGLVSLCGKRSSAERPAQADQGGRHQPMLSGHLARERVVLQAEALEGRRPEGRS